MAVELAMAVNEDVLGALETGDLVLFAPPRLFPWPPGRSGGRRWRHVGLVIRDTGHAEAMIWETVPAGATGAGVRLRRLGKRASRHRGSISVRRLNRALAPAQCRELEAWRHELERRQNRQNLIDLMGAGEDGWLGADDDHVLAPLPGELVALGYQRIGLLASPHRDGMEARWYTPRHFGARAQLRLALDFDLGPEIPLLEMDKTPARPTLTPQPA